MPVETNIFASAGTMSSGNSYDSDILTLSPHFLENLFFTLKLNGSSSPVANIVLKVTANDWRLPGPIWVPYDNDVDLSGDGDLDYMDQVEVGGLFAKLTITLSAGTSVLPEAYYTRKRKG